MLKLKNVTTKFLRSLANRTGIFIDKGFATNASKQSLSSLIIDYKRPGKLIIGEDESYTLNITNNQIELKSETDLGVLRGLQTLLQLVSFDKQGYFFPGLFIKDAPRFAWRGLMIDVARHFQPIAVIKRNLDAMAAVKMNVFHWHLTDDQGFRVESKKYPKLHELVSDKLYYTQEQIKDIVNYASNLGIRVVPEFDVPGHASAILTAYPELGSKDDYSYSIERFAGVFDPTLDPTKEKTYEFLDNLFKEITPLFPDQYFHIGGDENEGKHWDSNTKIQEFKKKNNLKTNHDLQTYFNIRLEKILKKYDKKLMGWDEIMTPNMPKTAVIHSWRGEHEGLGKGGTLIEAAKKGYNTVLSNGFYIDRMQSVVDHYLIEPIGDVKLSKEEEARILGGEVTMWSELVTPLTIDSRIWPRTAAIAERLWSHKEINDVENMYKRLGIISFQLEELGISHIKNRDVILRNITNNQNVNSLDILRGICEPLKIYSRNKGGTEYKSFSPFTLFADACTADAPDARGFNKAVEKFLKEKNKTTKSNLLMYFDKWIQGYENFEELNTNPILNQIKLPYQNLANISLIFKNTIISKDEIDFTKNKEKLNLLESIKEPFVDVELVIYKDLKRLYKFLEKEKLIKTN